MNNHDRVKEQIARGDKASAISLLASMLLTNKKDGDSWMLLGDLIDDPSKKRDCYRWALKLCPDDVQILTKLQALDEPPVTSPQITVPSAEQPESKTAEPESKPTLRNIPRQSLPSPAPTAQPKGGFGIIGYMAGGVGAFLMILYLIVNPDKFSTEILNIALVFMVLMAGIIILSAMNQNQR